MNEGEAMDVSEYADEHEGGQLRIACTGEQVPLLGLPDSAIPTVRCRDVAELLGDPLAELTPAALETIRGQEELREEPARVLGSDAATAVGRFEVDGPSGYRARSGGPVRETRAEAEADELAALDDVAAGDALDEAIAEQFGRHPAEPIGDELDDEAASYEPGEDFDDFAEELEPEGVDFAELHRQRLEGQTTHRERLERKAEKRRDWAESRARKAETTDAAARAKLDVIPFGQPVHGARDRNYREKARRGLDRAHEHRTMAQNHERAADGLEGQLRGAIYSDDADAVERLEEKLARLEQQRETMKARNAAYRREHRAELKTMSPYERSQAVPHASYELQNLGGNIKRNRDRLEQLKRAAVTVAAGGRGYGRPMVSRFSSSCGECGEPIEKGAEIVYYKLTREAVHAACDEKEG